MAEGGDEEAYTLEELLDAHEKIVEESTAVLGACDGDNCSYPQGYVNRQALYACLTCNPSKSPDFQFAGVCLACSLKCHEGHELIELYTKRNFRCDCGNKKFSGHPCALQPEKDDYNEKNLYNHNFKGVYCTCERPYPDPENDSDEDEMIQCICCEDWFHSKHSLVKDVSEAITEVCEMICTGCIQKFDFLNSYQHLILNAEKKDEVKKEEEKVDVETVEKETKTSDSSTSQQSQDSGISSSASIESDNNMEEKMSSCVLENSKFKNKIEGSALFISGWRGKLCKCFKCLEIYDKLQINYLLNEEDSLEKYEALGREKVAKDKDKENEQIDKLFEDLGHVGQIEFISGVNNFKEALNAFLKEESKDGKVITSEAIERFFQEFMAKRRRLNDGSYTTNHQY